MDTIINDLRYALRRLAGSPGFTLAALATMALGIGANSAMFTLVNAVMLRPMAVERPDQLVEIYTTGSDGIPATSSYPDYVDYRDQPVFAGGAIAYEATILNLSENGQSTVIFGEAASGNYFPVLGVRPTFGRLFGPDDDTLMAAPVAVLGVGFWQRRFGGDPTVIGRTMYLNGRPVTIIGVGPRDYTGGISALAVDMWVPFHTEFGLTDQRGVAARTTRANRSIFVRGRLAEGVSVEQAQAALQVVSARLAAAYPTTNQNRTTQLYRTSDVRFHPEVDKYLAPVAGLLMVVPALILLIACANIANLLLARATGRSREIAIRLAVGASRGRLVRLLLTESLTLAIVGGASGLLVAWWLMQAAEGWKPDGLPIPLVLDLSMDARVVWFTAAISTVTGIVFGLAPALQASRPSLAPALRDAATGSLNTYRRFGLRNGLVVAQVAVSLVLLTSAGLFVRSLQRAQDIDPGFERERAIIFTPIVEMSSVPAAQRGAFAETLRARLLALPGVEAVVFASRVPLGASVMTTDIVVDDQQPDDKGRGVDVDLTRVGPGYFAALGVPVLRGRDFTAQDTKETPRLAIVSEAFARRFWPDLDPIGRRVRFPEDEGVAEPPPATVVGVARDTKVRTLGEDPRPYLYMATLQDSGDYDGFVIRTAGDPASLVASVRRETLALDRSVPILELKTMREHLSLMLTPPRLAAALLGVCGTLAVLLASLGLYAVVAFAVARRTKEIGIRVALGATRRQVIGLVVSEGMTLVAVGVGVGVVLAAAVTRPLGAYLYGLGSFDPLTLASVVAVMTGTALLANYLPARRAVRVDPLKAIRYE